MSDLYPSAPVPSTELEHPPSPPAAKPKNRVFFGRFGLRAGWGIAIFLIVWFLATALGGIFGLASTGRLKEVIHAQNVAKAHPEQPKPHVEVPFVPSLVIVSDGITFTAMLGLCWFFSRGERRPISDYGIGRKRRSDVLPGAFWGLVMMSALVALLHALHLLVFDGRALHGLPMLGWGLQWLLAFTLVGFAEEYAFRGYVLYTLMRGLWGLAEKISPANPQAISFWMAATLLSLGFGAAHLGNGGENLFGISQVILIGLVFSYVLWRTGSLWWAIGFHATWDWAQSFLFGVADSGNVSVGRLFVTHPAGKPLLSGGTDGPEGSVFVVLAVVATFLVVRFTTRPGEHARPEQTPAIHNPSTEPLPAVA